MKTFRNPDQVHPPIASYTHQVEISAGERLLFLSGQVGRRLDGTVPVDPAEQFEIAIDNLLCNLQAANMQVTDIVKITFYLVKPIDPVKHKEILLFKLQGFQPCMTLLYVPSLVTPDYQIEIDAWASSTSPA
jgi:2-iminobutanoate/2-iminopropanoate deaminase